MAKRNNYRINSEKSVNFVGNSENNNYYRYNCDKNIRKEKEMLLIENSILKEKINQQNEEHEYLVNRIDNIEKIINEKLTIVEELIIEIITEKRS
jgi:hypothetical protein